MGPRFQGYQRALEGLVAGPARNARPGTELRLSGGGGTDKRDHTDGLLPGLWVGGHLVGVQCGRSETGIRVVREDGQRGVMKPRS